MAMPFSIGDILALSKVILVVTERCKTASKDLTDLQCILCATQSCIECARHSIADIYDSLPATHQRSISATIRGIRGIVDSIAQELDRYTKTWPFGSAKLSKLQFALFARPKEMESKLTLWMTTLNTCMGAITCDAVTKSAMKAENESLLSIQGDGRVVEGSCAAKTLEKWVSRSSAQSTGTMFSKAGTAVTGLLRSSTSPTERGAFVRGLYDYAVTADPIGGGKYQTHTVNHQLRITPTSITGTFTDDVGSGTLDGNIAKSGSTVRFLKVYQSPARMLGTYWEYEGTFTSCGIAGEWHFPGDPPEEALHRGKFALWLAEEEYEQNDAQPTTVSQEGKLLTKSMTYQ